MAALFTIVVLLFVIGVLAVVGFAVFEVTPFAKHKDHYRDPDTGARRWDSPSLD